MKGDKILVQPHHVRVARGIAEQLLAEIQAARGTFVITIAGESGAGKSEIASALAEILAEHELRSAILQQDDYFVYPPKTNASMRRRDIRHVGVSEVRLATLDENLKRILDGDSAIAKPLVDYDADSIGEETLSLSGIDAILVEGTYVTLLENVHRRVFIDRTYIDTRDARAERARELQDDFLENVLSIEHEIISFHKLRADIIVTRDYDVRLNDV